MISCCSGVNNKLIKSPISPSSVKGVLATSQIALKTHSWLSVPGGSDMKDGRYVSKLFKILVFSSKSNSADLLRRDNLKYSKRKNVEQHLHKMVSK